MNPKLPISLTLSGMIIAGLAWVLLSIFWAPAHMVSTTPYPVDQSPASRGLVYHDIKIPSGNLLLEGWWIPATQPVAEVVFVHGAGTNRTSRWIGSLDFYRTLHDLNVSIVTMDIRNHGNSPTTDGLVRMGAAEWPDVIAAAHWLDRYEPSRVPRILLGASMGGSTVIHALHRDLNVDALILLDPLLDVLDAMMEVGEIETGIPAPLFAIAARAAIHQYELPYGDTGPLALAKNLDLPILLMQDWDDPVTRSFFATELVNSNPRVTLARVPSVSLNDACLDGKEEWGSHVAAHPCHPEWTRKTISAFIAAISAARISPQI